VQHWLAQSRALLAHWKAEQQALLQDAGWLCLPSDTNYFCARAPYAVDAAALRVRGIKLRDTASMGLADHWRLGVLPPDAQAALADALNAQQELTP
jgi:histidinol-phosphate aminotransferase